MKKKTPPNPPNPHPKRSEKTKEGKRAMAYSRVAVQNLALHLVLPGLGERLSRDEEQ